MSYIAPNVPILCNRSSHIIVIACYVGVKTRLPIGVTRHASMKGKLWKRGISAIKSMEKFEAALKPFKIYLSK